MKTEGPNTTEIQEIVNELDRLRGLISEQERSTNRKMLLKWSKIEFILAFLRGIAPKRPKPTGVR